MSSLLKAVYDTNAFVPHAALLRQGCPHCAIFPTAASRRSLGRISVPMWPVGLSTRLPVVGTVGLCPAVYLMGRDPIHRRRSFPPPRMRGEGNIGYQSAFRRAVPVRWAGWSRVTHPFATLYAPEGALTVRLACVRHAASVHPEPGSNSPFEKALQVKSINVVRPHRQMRAPTYPIHRNRRNSISIRFSVRSIRFSRCGLKGRSALALPPRSRSAARRYITPLARPGQGEGRAPQGLHNPAGGAAARRGPETQGRWQEKGKAGDT